MRKYMAEQDAGIREKVSHGDIFLPVSSYHCLVPAASGRKRAI